MTKTTTPKKDNCPWIEIGAPLHDGHLEDGGKKEEFAGLWYKKSNTLIGNTTSIMMVGADGQMYSGKLVMSTEPVDVVYKGKTIEKTTSLKEWRTIVREMNDPSPRVDSVPPVDKVQFSKTSALPSIITLPYSGNLDMTTETTTVTYNDKGVQKTTAVDAMSIAARKPTKSAPPPPLHDGPTLLAHGLDDFKFNLQCRLRVPEQIVIGGDYKSIGRLFGSQGGIFQKTETQSGCHITVETKSTPAQHAEPSFGSQPMFKPTVWLVVSSEANNYDSAQCKLKVGVDMVTAILTGVSYPRTEKSKVTVVNEASATGRLFFDHDSELSGNVPTISMTTKETTEISDNKLDSLYEWFLAEDDRHDAHQTHPQAHFICSAACLREMKMPRWQYFKKMFTLKTSLKTASAWDRTKRSKAMSVRRRIAMCIEKCQWFGCREMFGGLMSTEELNEIGRDIELEYDNYCSSPNAESRKNEVTSYENNLGTYCNAMHIVYLDSGIYNDEQMAYWDKVHVQLAYLLSFSSVVPQCCFMHRRAVNKH